MKAILIRLTDEQFQMLEHKRKKNPKYSFADSVRRWFDEIIKY